MDIFGDDIDSILDSRDDPLNANAKFTADDDDENDNEGNDNANIGDDPDAPRKLVEPKRRTIRNPQLRLNAERLIGDERGVHTLEKYFANTKLRGRGHETADLDTIMKKIEHWAHRLYPSFNFDDFLEKAEKLGHKKQLQRHMNRYRQGLLDPRPDNGSGDEAAETGNGDDGCGGRHDDVAMCEPIDEFDDLIGQQIEKYRSTYPQTPSSAATANDTAFNALRNVSGVSGMTMIPSTPSGIGGGPAPVVASTPMNHQRIDSDFRLLTVDTPTQSPKLTADQLARMEENKRLARERLRLKREAAGII